MASEQQALASPVAGYEVPYPTLGSRLGAEELDILGEVLSSGDGLSQGPWREKFERAFRDSIGVRHAFTVTSGTVALEIAIGLLDLRPGDEVIATPQTYHATVQPLVSRSVAVRFCDVDSNSLNLGVDRLAALITERTRAIVLVHYGGFPAPMREIMRLARDRGILVIEDCAHALGARYQGRRPGSLADIGCFSFHSSKAITTLGEGGMITFDRDDWAERVTRIRGNECDATYRDAPQGFTQVPKALYPGRAYSHDCRAIRHPGTNATMSEPAAAVGLAQLAKLPALTARRREIARVIDELLGGYDGIRVQRLPAGSVSGQHLYTCFVEPGGGLDRDALVAALEELGVEVWLRYFPLHLLPEWRSRGHRYGECPVAERLWFGSQLNLPCHPALSDAQVERLLTALQKAIPAARS
jgi:perosamine synthetase